jgi:hypothetical protein
MTESLSQRRIIYRVVEHPLEPLCPVFHLLGYPRGKDEPSYAEGLSNSKSLAFSGIVRA